MSSDDEAAPGDDDGLSDHIAADRTRRSAIGLLVMLGGLAALVAVVVSVADPFAVVDGDLRSTALIAIAVGFGLVGLTAVLAVPIVAPPAAGSRQPGRLFGLVRAAAGLAVVGLVAALALAVTAVLVEDVESEPVAQIEPTATDEGGTTTVPAEGDAAIGFLAPSRVFVTLTGPGRKRVAEAMGCEPEDVPRGSLTAIAVGGDYSSPLLVIRPQANDDPETPPDACSPARVRLKPKDGLIVPA